MTLPETAQKLVAKNKGILAADESFPTIEKRFKKIGLPSTEETRRAYRELLFTVPETEKYISGIIMFDETIRQKTSDGIPFPKVLEEKGIIPGIKVDEGKKEAPMSPKESITKGLDGLSTRLKEYKELGARFAKWRAVFLIGENTPSTSVIEENALGLAEYAYVCQQEGIVPVVEPEVLTDGDHDIEKCGEVTKNVLTSVFSSLERRKVDLKGMLLKPNWVHPGKDFGTKPTDEEVAEKTLAIFKRVIPPEVPGIVFLSGGDSPEDSTGHLNAMNKIDNVPWELSFSFGRALQEPVLATWKGKEENVKKAQEAFLKHAKLNSLARSGQYKKEMEK